MINSSLSIKPIYYVHLYDFIVYFKRLLHDSLHCVIAFVGIASGVQGQAASLVFIVIITPPL